jgi:hypothetical protein
MLQARQHHCSSCMKSFFRCKGITSRPVEKAARFGFIVLLTASPCIDGGGAARLEGRPGVIKATEGWQFGRGVHVHVAPLGTSADSRLWPPLGLERGTGPGAEQVAVSSSHDAPARRRRARGHTVLPSYCYDLALEEPGTCVVLSHHPAGICGSISLHVLYSAPQGSSSPCY